MMVSGTRKKRLMIFAQRRKLGYRKDVRATLHKAFNKIK